MTVIKDHEEQLARQREYLKRQDGCRCLIHHVVDPDLREEMFQAVRSSNPVVAGIAVESLAPCPTRRPVK